MRAHAHSFQEINEAELFAKIQAQLINRYNVDEKLANEMAWDFMEVLSATEGDFSIFEKYFLN